MANIVDETNRELWNGIKNTPERLLRLIRAIQQIHDWYEKHHNTQLKDNLEDLKKSYDEQLKKLNEAEKELSEKYNVLYETAMEKENYEIILPETYNDIKTFMNRSNCIAKKIDNIVDTAKKDNLSFDEIKNKVRDYDLYNDFSNNDFSDFGIPKQIEHNEDFKQFLERYSEEYEDLNLDDFMWEDGSLNWDDLLQYTDISEDLFEPMFLSIARDEVEIHEAVEQCKQTVIADLEKVEQKKQIKKIEIDDMEL